MNVKEVLNACLSKYENEAMAVMAPSLVEGAKYAIDYLPVKISDDAIAHILEMGDPNILPDQIEWKYGEFLVGFRMNGFDCIVIVNREKCVQHDSSLLSCYAFIVNRDSFRSTSLYFFNGKIGIIEGDNIHRKPVSENDLADFTLRVISEWKFYAKVCAIVMFGADIEKKESTPYSAKGRSGQKVKAKDIYLHLSQIGKKRY